MKKALFLPLAAVSLAAGIGWYVWRGSENPAPVEETWAARNGPPPTRSLTDPVAIFKKAFWREPGAGDQIRHAVRHEWSDAEGITKWAWFLEVNASPELLKYLREDNSFGLAKGEAAPLPEDRPDWFRFAPEEVNVLGSLRGNLRLYFRDDGKTLFAADSGKGFARGASAPASPVSEISPTREASVSGRLPPTSPPKPSP